MSKRRKKNSTSSSKTENSYEEGKFDLFSFRVELLKSLKLNQIIYYIYGKGSKNREVGKRNWPRLTDKQKIEKVLKETKGDELKVLNYIAGPAIYMMLKKLPFNALKKLYKKYLDPKGQATKDKVISELFHVFYGKRTSKEKRKMEKENIEEMGSIFTEGDEFRFIDICGKTIPNELVVSIFEYLPRNSEILYSVGRICKHFYLLLLTTWKELRINRKTNVESISLLVLGNISKITIIKTTSQNVPQMKLHYLWRNLNPGKLRSLEISGHNPSFVTDGYKRFKNLKANKNVEVFALDNITTFISKNQDKPIYDLFPKLLESDTRNLHLMSQCKDLRKITFNWTLPRYFGKKMDVKSDLDRFIREQDKNNIHTSKITSFTLNNVPAKQFNEIGGEMLRLMTEKNRFPDVDTVHLIFGGDGYRSFVNRKSNEIKKPARMLNLTDLHLFSSVRKVGIYDDSKRNRGWHIRNISEYRLQKKRPFLFHNPNNVEEEDPYAITDLESIYSQEESIWGVRYPNNNNDSFPQSLDELIISSTKGVVRYSTDQIDFCLEGMLKERFFETCSKSSVAKLVVKVPFLSRKIDYHELFFHPKMVRDEKVKRDNFTDTNILGTISNFIGLLESGVLFTFRRRLEVRAMVYDRFFKQESFSLVFDRLSNGVRRMQISFDCNQTYFFSSEDHQKTKPELVQEKRYFMSLLVEEFLSKSLGVLMENNEDKCGLDLVVLKIRYLAAEKCQVFYDKIHDVVAESRGRKEEWVLEESVSTINFGAVEDETDLVVFDDFFVIARKCVSED